LRNRRVIELGWTRRKTPEIEVETPIDLIVEGLVSKNSRGGWI
jgi:hypothetical protein